MAWWFERFWTIWLLSFFTLTHTCSHSESCLFRSIIRLLSIFTSLQFQKLQYAVIAILNRFDVSFVCVRVFFYRTLSLIFQLKQPWPTLFRLPKNLTFSMCIFTIRQWHRSFFGVFELILLTVDVLAKIVRVCFTFSVTHAGCNTKVSVFHLLVLSSSPYKEVRGFKLSCARASCAFSLWSVFFLRVKSLLAFKRYNV